MHSYGKRDEVFLGFIGLVACLLIAMITSASAVPFVDVTSFCTTFCSNEGQGILNQNESLVAYHEIEHSFTISDSGARAAPELFKAKHASPHLERLPTHSYAPVYEIPPESSSSLLFVVVGLVLVGTFAIWRYKPTH